jgi:hypothetical protein
VTGSDVVVVVVVASEKSCGRQSRVEAKSKGRAEALKLEATDEPRCMAIATHACTVEQGQDEHDVPYGTSRTKHWYAGMRYN